MNPENKQTVLIIEDDEFLRSLTAKRLEKDGYRTAVAVDGDVALNVALETKPNLILLDLLLPGVDGFEVLRRIRANEPIKDTPVIVFSNLGQQEYLDRATQLGANDFLVKSNFTLDDLIAKINIKLGRSSAVPPAK